MQNELTRNISEILPIVTTQTTAGQISHRGENWRRFVSGVEHDLRYAGIDLLPEIFPKAVAMTATRELKKGVLIMGTPGTGKTVRLKFIARQLGIAYRTALDIARVAVENTDMLPEYCRCDNARWSDIPRHFFDLIIDDLGSEPAELVIYGTRYNALADVIENRYNKFPDAKTHIATNLNREQLQERYGERVYSRLNEMCNFINLTGEDRRMQR